MSPLSTSALHLDAARRARLHDAARARAHALRQAAINDLLDRLAAALRSSARHLLRRAGHCVPTARQPGLEG